MRYIPTWILAVSIAAAIGLSAMVDGHQTIPRPNRWNTPTILIGTGCTGPSSVIVGEEESDFPACERIERHYLPQ